MRFWSLALIAAASGIATMAIYRRFGNLEQAGISMKRLLAHLLELRLYAHEPALIWRAQLAACRESARLFWWMLKPSLLIALPMAWLVMQLDWAYGFAPLPIGKASVVTVHLKHPPDNVPALLAPAEIVVEVPPVRVVALNEVSWRILPLSDFRGEVTLSLDGAEHNKSLSAGADGMWLSMRRLDSTIGFLLHPRESRLPAGGVEWIEVEYPHADVRLGNLKMPWWAWFSGISTLSALIVWRFD